MIISNNSPIGFYDSGVGGLTVLDKVKKLLPNEDFIYFGDTLHMPYGEKTKERLLEYSDKIFKFFEQKGCKAVVMACNTTSSTIYEDVKNNYCFKLYPIVQSVAKLLSELPIETLGVFATRATIESCAYEKNINKYNSKMKVYGQICPKWVHIVEEAMVNDKESLEIIKKDLEKMLAKSPEKIVLGCTHYPYLLNVLSKLSSKELFIDPASYFAEYVRNDLANMGMLKKSGSIHSESFYVSSDPKGFFDSAKMFYRLENEPELVCL